MRLTLVVSLVKLGRPAHTAPRVQAPALHPSYQAPHPPLRAAVFLDRDGTLNVERHYLADPKLLELFPDAVGALQRLATAKFRLFIVTNQSGIGRGYYSEADMHRVNARLLDLLARDGVVVDGVYFAPEAPEQPSRGRKPSPQFLFDARDAHQLDLAASYMVGDKLADLECGWNAGVRASVLVRTGYGRETESRHPELARRSPVVDSLATAADWILRDAAGR